MCTHGELLAQIRGIQNQIHGFESKLANVSSIPEEVGAFVHDLSKKASFLLTAAADGVTAVGPTRWDRISARLASHFLVEKYFNGFCQQVLDELISETRASMGTLLVFQQNGSRAEAIAARDSERRDCFHAELFVGPSALSQIRRGKPWLVVDEEHRGDGLGSAHTSSLVVPLRVLDQVAGAFCLAKSSKGDFTEDDRSLLIEVSRTMAVYWSAAHPPLVDSAVPRKAWQEIRAESRFEGIVTPSDPLLDVLEIVTLAGPSDATVLIEGETGTGKELIAEAIRRRSTRAARPYCVVNCAAIPETLVESELFGHERGAFTNAVERRVGLLESGNGGTVFLDEIAEIPLALQPKLLRFLQFGEIQRVGATKITSVDDRVMAATSRNLKAMVRQGTFREDLFFRLNVVPIQVPPLRERAESIPALASHFAQVFARAQGLERIRIDPEVYEILKAFPWPGNVRQLEGVIQRMVVLTGKDRLTRLDVPEEISSGRTLVVEIDQNPFRRFFERMPVDYDDLKRAREEMQRVLSSSIERLDREFVGAILAKDSNVSRAAREAGMHRTLIYRILKRRGDGETSFDACA